MSYEKQKQAAKDAGWPEEKIRWNGGFYPGFTQVMIKPKADGKIAQWEKFTGQKYGV